MNSVKLNFKKSETRLAGFPFGKKIYNEQVKDNISLDDDVTIEFPKQIEKVASSFVQGFFSDIINKLGYIGVDEKITIKAGTEKLEDEIKKNIY